ncbi:hypothetical protein EUTSA_v10027480mg, partial [Eutrema salsugineum]
SVIVFNARHGNTKRFPSNVVSKVMSAQTVTVRRRSANYRPSLWDHQYLHNIYAKEVEAVEKAKLLKEEVRKTLTDQGSIEKLEMIDVLQRLGISYHYKHEIHNILKKIHDNRGETEREPKDLHATALEFFLLRQHGFDVSHGYYILPHYYTVTTYSLINDHVTNQVNTTLLLTLLKVKPEYSKKIYATILSNIKGLLSLYEASYLSMDSEFKLKEARAYANERLNEFVEENNKAICGKDETYMLEMVKRVLEKPYHLSLRRFEARWYIDVYPKKHDMDPLLLELATLDFNMVQAYHQEELKLISSTGLMKQLDFVRDRITESYFWSIGIFYEPEFKYYRKILTKIAILIAIMDDIYDIY